MDTLLTHKQLLQEISSRLGRSPDRSTVYRWRQVLGFREPPYAFDHVEALTQFGKLVGLGVRPDRAKQMTINYMESKS